MIRNASATVRKLLTIAEQRGYSQSAIAAALDVQPKDVWRWRAGQRMPGIMTIEHIAAVIRIET